MIRWGLPRLLWTGAYAGLVVWFQGVDVYHKHFAATGVLVLAHNVFRALFIFYLFWIVHAAGTLMLRLAGGKAVDSLGVLERLAAGFFAGTGVWHLTMLALGYLNLYTVPVAVALTLPVVALSYGNFAAAAQGTVRALRDRDALARSLCRDNRLIAGMFIAAAAATVIMLLLVKGLYPGGGHDYFTHYFYYYQTVVERGGIWPNDIWYQYYYCKGAGLFFLAMLLTDPLAPQLVSFCFIVVAALALFLFLRRVAPDTLWPAAGTILFLALHIFTPSSTSMFRVHGGWSEFEKLHELVAALVMAVMWASAGALERSGRMRLLWWLVAASSIVAAVAIDATIAIVLGGVFALLTLWLLATREVLQSVLCVSLGAVAAVALIFILVLNQITSGLALDQGLRLFWNFADVETLSRWGALADVMYLYRDRAVGEGSGTAILSLAMARFLVEAARVELLFPLVGCGLMAAVAARWRGPWTFVAPLQGAAVVAVVLVFVALGVTAGRAQPISYYRYSTFVVAFMIAAGVLAWGVAAVARSEWLKRLARNEYTASLVFLACLVLLKAMAGPYTLLTYGARFAIGTYSIDQAYQSQFGPLPRTTWTAIYPGARGAYEVVGPGTRIWSFHVHTYCMLPDCRIETFHSFLMTPRADQVLFGTAEEAKRVLQDSGLNYFLFTSEAGLFDPLPLSALFHPDHIAEHLAIRWTDGTTTLLTWAGPDTVPLDAAWLSSYRNAAANSGTVSGYPYAELKAIFARLNATPRPWRKFKLPWEPN
jgi:hypothetical protein